jgi:hypothetical protein
MDYKILNKFDLTEEEKQFIKESQTASASDMNHSRVISDIFLAKTLELITNRFIESNKILSDSNNKYANRMLWLTGGLVFVGLIQIIIQTIQIYLHNYNY